MSPPYCKRGDGAVFKHPGSAAAIVVVRAVSANDTNRNADAKMQLAQSSLLIHHLIHKMRFIIIGIYFPKYL